MPIKPEDQHKTAFSAGRGLYHYVRMPFGLSTAPATMQYAMENLLHELSGAGCFVYMDDIVVYGATIEEHDTNLHKVLQKLASKGFKIKLPKCEFRKTRIRCLGHVISGQGVWPQEDKVQAIKEMPPPRNVKQLRSFLGLASYYRRFIQNFSKVAKPLNRMLQKDRRWAWKNEEAKAFQTIKDAISSDSCLIHPNFKEEFHITTDASREGIGAVLTQTKDGKERPIAFYSRSLAEAEKKYPTHDLEGLAIKSALNKWRYYIKWYKIVVYTDNQPIIQLFKQKECDGRIAKYLATIQEYNVTFKYIPGKSNTVADCMSRNIQSNKNQITDNETAKVGVVRTRKQLQGLKFHDMLDKQDRDKEISETKKKVRANPDGYRDKQVVDDVLYHKATDGGLRIEVPKEMKPEVLKHFHDQLGYHEGIRRTQQRISRYYHWKNIYQEVEEYVKSCETCGKNKMDHLPKAEIKNFPHPQRIGERIHIDLFGPLRLTARKNRFVLVAVDAYSKWTELIPLTSKDPKGIIKALTERINPNGTVNILVSDQGTEFKAAQVREYCEQNNVQQEFCNPYHQSSNGLVERQNLTIANALRCRRYDGGKAWDEELEGIQISMNTAHHDSLGMSPYQVKEGYSPELPLAYSKGHLVYKNYNYDITKRFDHKKANDRRKRICPKQGDLVYCKIETHKTKIAPLYDGPYIVERAEPERNSLYIKLMDGTRLQRRVHLDQVKRCHPRFLVMQPPRIACVIKTIRKDIFRSDPTVPKVHCISADAALTKGIAKTFDDKYNIKKELRTERLKVGQCVETYGRGHRILNLVTKERYFRYPTYDDLENTFIELKNQIQRENIKEINAPKLGCGLDKLEWTKVITLLTRVFKDTPVVINIFEHETNDLR